MKIPALLLLPLLLVQDFAGCRIRRLDLFLLLLTLLLFGLLLIFGLVASTLFTLFVIPISYRLLRGSAA